MRSFVISVLIGSSLLCTAAENGPKEAPSKTRAAVVKLVDNVGVKQILSQDKGQVVALTLWATWCDPCREELADWVRLHDNYKQRGLRLILLSVDQEEDLENVKGFLREKEVCFESYLSVANDVDSIANVLDPQWFRAVPATFLFDRKGKRVKTLLGGQTYEQLLKAVEPYL